MPWARFDDQFPDHPKVALAGPAAGWLFVCGVCYCARMLTDGFIPIGQIRKLADVDNPVALADRLVEVGLWENADGGYRVHDYLEYNPSAQQVKMDREELSRIRAEAGRKGAEARWQNGKPHGKRMAEPLANAMANGCQNDGPVPIPIPESHTQIPVLSTTSARPSASRGTRLENPFVLPEEWRVFAERERPQFDAMVEGQKFADYWHGVPGTRALKTDWYATWRNYVRSDLYGRGQRAAKGRHETVTLAERACEYESLLQNIGHRTD